VSKKNETAPNIVKDQVPNLVKEHMAWLNGSNSKTVKRLAVRLSPASIEDVCIVMRADKNGRGLGIVPTPQIDAISNRAKEIKIETKKPEPLVLGRDLLAIGFSAGPTMGILLKKAFEAQLNEEFNNKETGIDWILKNQNNTTLGVV